MTQPAGGKGQDIWSILKNNEMMDFSNFPKDHPSFNDDNKLVPGYFKSEFSNRCILEFVGLSAKVYSIKSLEGQIKKTHKGISKTFQENVIRHEHYVDVLLKKEKFKHTSTTKQILSKHFKVFTIQREKKYLCPYNGKRYFLNDFQTLAFGNKRLKN